MDISLAEAKPWASLEKKARARPLLHQVAGYDRLRQKPSSPSPSACTLLQPRSPHPSFTASSPFVRVYVAFEKRYFNVRIRSYLLKTVRLQEFHQHHQNLMKARPACKRGQGRLAAHRCKVIRQGSLAICFYCYWRPEI